MWPFHKKSFEEKVNFIKKYAADHKASGPAFLVYCMIALKYGWEDVAEHFADSYWREELRIHIGEEP